MLGRGPRSRISSHGGRNETAALSEPRLIHQAIQVNIGGRKTASVGLKWYAVFESAFEGPSDSGGLRSRRNC